MTLSIETIRSIASRHCYNEVQFNETSRVISFKKNTSCAGGSTSTASTNDQQQSIRINVYYTTGTVATCLDHPRSGKTQLFRRNQTEYDLDALFGNPRIHTGMGYYTRQGALDGVWQTNQKRSRHSHTGSHDGDNKREECDDARRWRYVQAATIFCNDSQVGQIAAIARLWHSLRFMSGGMTCKERFDSYNDEKKRALMEVNASCTPCCDAEDSPCSCLERAGAFCSLMAIATKIALEREPIVAFYETKRERLSPVQTFACCTCDDGIIFRDRYSRMLSKLERQLRSLPKGIFNEVFFWYLEKMTQGQLNAIIYDGEGHEPQFFGSSLCSDEIRGCHFDYGEMVYGDNCKKGSYCHGM